jgi:hypothetical protein
LRWIIWPEKNSEIFDILQSHNQLSARRLQSSNYLQLTDVGLRRSGRQFFYNFPATQRARTPGILTGCTRWTRRRPEACAFIKTTADKLAGAAEQVLTCHEPPLDSTRRANDLLLFGIEFDLRGRPNRMAQSENATAAFLVGDVPGPVGLRMPLHTGARSAKSDSCQR